MSFLRETRWPKARVRRRRRSVISRQVSPTVTLTLRHSGYGTHDRPYVVRINHGPEFLASRDELTYRDRFLGRVYQGVMVDPIELPSPAEWSRLISRMLRTLAAGVTD
jgi:hypothetical protein